MIFKIILFFNYKIFIEINCLMEDCNLNLKNLSNLIKMVEIKN